MNKFMETIKGIINGIKGCSEKVNNAVHRFIKGRSLKYGSNSIILVVTVIAIIIVVNVIVNISPVKMDLTPEKLYSIGDTSKKILNGMEKDVVIYGLFDDGTIGAGSERKELTELLGQYEKYPHIKVEYVDPDKKPGFIKSIDPNNLKELVKQDFLVVCGSKMKKLSYYDMFDVQFDQQTLQQYVTGSTAEYSFTGAIKYVTADVTPAVYFTQGHDEVKVDSDYKTVKQYLEMNNFEVKMINLLTQEKVPDDASLVIVVSPKRDFSTAERDKLKEYLKGGGKGIFLFDSLETDPVFTELENILVDYNISLGYDKVKENDEQRHVPDNAYDILPDISTNSIISESFQMIVPKSRSINILKNTKEYITVTSLMKTSGKAVGEQIDKSRGKDKAGPLDLAVAVENKGGYKPVKIIVMGNSNFISDSAMDTYGNYSRNGIYFFLNCLNWMQDKKDDLVIEPKSYDTKKLTINAQQASLAVVFVVALMPLLILGTGTLVWLKRRHL